MVLACEAGTGRKSRITSYNVCYTKLLWARARFRCRYRNGRYEVPSRTVIREILTRVDPGALDRALQRWNTQYAVFDEGLAIDGKTMCNAIDEEGRQTHILGVVGHQSQICHTQKKSAPCP